MKLSSFGFRGEALSAIGSIAKVQVETRRTSEPVGSFYIYENGTEVVLEDSQRECGTKISITHLFESTPARKKFLKSNRHELTLVKKVLKDFCLKHYKTSFKLLIDRKISFFYPSVDTIQKRYSEVVKGSKVYKIKLTPCDTILEGSCLYLEEPSIQSKTGQSLWVYIQDRSVQDKTVAAATRDGLNTYLMHGTFPKGVVDLKLRKDSIDVNVHPMKSEVRFENSSYIYKSVRRAVSDWAYLAPWKNEVITDSSLSAERISSSVTSNSKQNSLDANNTTPLASTKSFSVSSQKPSREYSSYQEKKLAFEIQNPNANAKRDVFKPQTEISNTSFKSNSYKQNDFKVSEPEVLYKKTYGSLNSKTVEDKLLKKEGFEPYWSKLMIVGQINLTYIMAQGDDAVYFIDQHAAHERVAFERLKTQWEKRKESKDKCEVQNLLIPLYLDLDETLTEELLKLNQELFQLGIEIESSGPETLAVNSIPSFLKEESIDRGLRKLAKESLEQGGGSSIDDVFELFFATLACHSVIRAGHAMSDDEMKLLLLSMDEFKSRYCPHGRPVYKKISFHSLDQDFGRVV
jgi:DNA mismatch repair protein MutL